MTARLEKLQPGVLPLFRHTLNALTAFSRNRDQVTAKEIATQILADPFATLYLMHTINKRVSERSGTEVNTVEHALMMQGINAFLDAARRLPVLEETPAGRDPRTYAAIQELTRRAQHAAWQARDFAVLHNDIRAEEVQVAALLFSAPDLLLWLRAPDQAARLKRRRRRVSEAEAETAVLGDTLANLRPILLENWNIPPLTLELLGAQNPERARPAILNACCSIATLSERGWWNEQLMAAYITLASVENTALETVIATVHANAARVARCCSWLDAAPAAAWGPMNPGPWPLDEYDADEVVERQAAPVATNLEPGVRPSLRPAPAPDQQLIQPPRPAKPVEPEVEHDVCPMPDKAVFRDTLKSIDQHLDGTLTLNQMSAVILKGLHTGLGLSRIIFAMMTPDGLRVKSRFTLGISSQDPLRHFEFELASNDLFCQLMGKMQGVWLSDSNRQKLWPMINPKMQAMLGEGDFFTMSLYNGSKPMGLIYADRGKGECGLDPLTYTDFKMLCLQAARGLGKIKAPV